MTKQWLLAILGVALSATVAPKSAVAQEASWDYVEVEPEGAHDFIGKDWFKRIEISGYGAVGYSRTSKDGADRNGSFEMQEASLFIEADLAEAIVFFHELEIGGSSLWRNIPGNGDNVTPQETYVVFRDPIFWADQWEGALRMKIGRIDAPYGEEYIKQDAIDNVLIDFSANWPWGRSEGILFYGATEEGEVNYMAGIFNGNYARSQDNNVDKQYNLKATYEPTKHTYFSASYMYTGDVDVSSNWFGGILVAPVNFASTEISAHMYELAAKYKWDDSSSLWLTWGQVFQDDENNDLDRDLYYWTFQPLMYLCEDMYLVGRYSAFGTFDSNEGYYVSAWDFGKGQEYGFNVSSLQRFQIGLGYHIEQNVLAKLEYHRDYFDLIDGYSLPGVEDTRDFYGAQVVVKF